MSARRFSQPSALSRALRRFARDEEASVIAEAVLVLPLLLWAYIGLFVYWDCFRSLNTVQKATYTIADMITRERTGITSTYVDGLKEVVDYLIDSDQTARLRVSSIYWSTTNSRYEVHWSRSTEAGVLPALTTTTLQAYAAEIPTLAAGEYLVIVEVQVPYVPAFNVGITNQTFNFFIVTRPRFLMCIPMDGGPCPV